MNGTVKWLCAGLAGVAGVMASVGPVNAADAVTTPAAQKPVEMAVSTPASAAAASKPSGLTVTAGPVTVKPYGYIKLDAAYDSQRTSMGDIPFYVYPKSATGGKNDNEFNMTARETRLGLDLAGPDVESIETTGKIEADFYGGGSANSANPRIRLAFLDLKTPYGTSLRAGQDWETFITAIPRTLNFGYLADLGALGLRRPQLRLTQDVPLFGDTKLVAKAAAARTIGEDIDGGGQDDGADSGTPTAQGNLYLESKWWPSKSAKAGVSGHFGNETVDTVVSNKVTVADSKDYNSYSVIGSAVLPIHPMIALQGTIWQGKNLDTYYGGVGQGINKTLGCAIGAKGGWAQVVLEPSGMNSLLDRCNLNVGYGLDDPDNGDLNSGNRSKNEIIFSSLYVKITSAVTAALEYANIVTSYASADDATDNRMQGSMIYKF